jgi:uncharacterized protein
MNYSKHNIISRVKDQEDFFIVNLLTGEADLLDSEEATQIHQGIQPDGEFGEILQEKRYLVNPEEEKRLYKSRYFDFLNARDTDEIQLFFILNYSCNFDCTYCYQDEYSNPRPIFGNEVIDAFFDYLQTEFSGRRKYITVFGGEPLLNTPGQKEKIAYLIQKSNENNLELCFVTNGYHVTEYLDLLKTARIREIQITLDGTETVHNQRRFLAGGGKTFDKIAKGVDLCLENQIPVNLRMVIDKENIDNLPKLARFAIERGWTKSSFFKTQIGRNYELHHCQSTPEKLFSRISLFKKIYELIEEHPYLTEFYQPAYSVAKHLSQAGVLPDPLFDACPACKTEWAFDYSGKIYSCTATVGKEGEVLGTFYPAVSKNPEKIDEWETRDVTSIPECRNCSVQLACGGGCGAVAKNKNGSIGSPDCRPVKELLELGFAAYLMNEK